ncbi:hypothetical protein L5515_012986 [Caenorhabditis briggsae]|uniref:Uncharacterized protein n=1 Tax=Caenorhabditis briggsae TaxID=6238 RepID=A0AAE9E7U1_CAEBR|nr:hypothetical protein L5515_012986 [Caenorhabditis briggsae]
MPFTLTHENICFSNPAAKYAPGDKLEGLIELNFQKDYNVLYMQNPSVRCNKTVASGSTSNGDSGEGYRSSFFIRREHKRQLPLWINEKLNLGAVNEEKEDDNSEPPTYAEATGSDQYPPTC